MSSSKRTILLLLLFLPSLLCAEDRLAFIYYYGWYGNPDWNADWVHWQEYDHTPPRDLSSAYYPRLGAYSSADPKILEQHVRWMAGANFNAIIYSWWGQGDFSDEPVKPLLDLAADYGLKLTFLIEPYPGRTAASICNDIDFLMEKYGGHPAFLRISHKAREGDASAPRGMFFIYQPEIHPEADLRSLADKVRDARNSPLLLLQSTDVAYGIRTGVDGIFAYEAFQNLQHFYSGIVLTARNAGLIFVPCVSPGFNVNRTMKEKSEVFRARRLGKTFDDWWEHVIAAESEFVSVISFNEWHEGTQIEPAAPAQGYLTYEGAYGKQQDMAEFSYLRRAARWIQLFQNTD